MYISKVSAVARFTAVVLGTLLLCSCGLSGDTSSEESSTSVTALDGTVNIFAAASLNSAGTDLEARFEQAYPEADVSFNYAGSAQLVQQMEQGATPDLLITADRDSMTNAVVSVPELAGVAPQNIASNTLVLAVAGGNPAGIDSLDDLASENVTTAICAPEVPCGKLAHRVLNNKGVIPGKTTEEQNVSEVATKVSTGAVEAGFIYSTDAAAITKNQDMTVIDLPGGERNHYPMALTTAGSQNSTAGAFAEWVVSAPGREVLSKHGFGPAE